jgi:hypothetical protein
VNRSVGHCSVIQNVRVPVRTASGERNICTFWVLRLVMSLNYGSFYVGVAGRVKADVLFL